MGSLRHFFKKTFVGENPIVVCNYIDILSVGLHATLVACERYTLNACFKLINTEQSYADTL